MKTKNHRPFPPVLSIHFLSIALIASAFVISGCATNLSTLQTADTVTTPGVRVGAGAGLYVPTGTVRDMDPRTCVSSDNEEGAVSQMAGCIGLEHVNFLRDIQSGDLPQIDPTNPEDMAKVRDMMHTALGLTLFPPAPMAEVSGRLGVGRNQDVGLKLTPLSVRADYKRRLIGRSIAMPVSVAVLAGVEYYLYDELVVDMEEYLTDQSELFNYMSIDGPSRIDFEGAAIASIGLGIFHPYAALKVRGGRFSVPLNLTVDHPDHETFTLTEDITGTVLYTGGTVGLGFGLRWLRIFGEVTAMNAVSNVTIIEEDFDLGGFTIYPAIGIAAQLP